MGRATQLLAYHGRTALLLGPMPRRAIPTVANLAMAVRPLVDVSDHARNVSVKAAAGLQNPAHNLLLATTVVPLGGALVRHGDGAAPTPRSAQCGAAEGRIGLV